MIEGMSLGETGAGARPGASEANVWASTTSTRIGREKKALGVELMSYSVEQYNEPLACT
jgi:hypothetical protein